MGASPESRRTYRTRNWIPGSHASRAPRNDRGLERLLVDRAVATHVPLLARERLAGDAIGEPVGDENWRERPEIRCRHVADRMARLLVHHHPLRPLHRCDEAMRVLD